MSYCVNCGVELDKALKDCPLCGTKVYHPGRVVEPLSETFPEKKGEVDKDSQKEVIIFVSVVLFAIVVTCSLLNRLVYDMSKWSLPVISICIILWAVFMGAVLVKRITVYGMLVLDAIAVLVGLYLVTDISEIDRWYLGIGVPIVCAILFIMELFVIMSKKLLYNMLVGTIYFFIVNAAFCVSIEAIIDYYYSSEIHLSWSAIVLTVCAIITIALGTIMMMSRLRNAIKKRLHF